MTASLPQDVKRLGWVSFFADISSEMLYPLLPLYITQVVGGTAETVGIIEGSAALLIALLHYAAGRRSDRLGRRAVFVRIGYCLPVIGKLVIAAATVWPIVHLGRLIDRFGKGLRSSPRDAIIADLTGPNDRGRAFGFHRAMDTTGAALGVLLAAAVLWAAGTPSHEWPLATVLRGIVILSGMLGLGAFVITLKVRDPSRTTDRSPDRDITAAERANPPSRRAGATGGQPPHAGAAPDGECTPPGFRRALIALLFFAAANTSDLFLILFAQEMGLSPLRTVLCYAAYVAAAALMAYPAGILADRFGRRAVLGAGASLYAMVYASLTRAPALLPLLIVYGAAIGMTDGATKAIIADFATPSRRSRTIGLFLALSGATTFAASLLVGRLWIGHSPRAALDFCAIAAVMSVILLAFVPRARRSV